MVERALIPAPAMSFAGYSYDFVMSPEVVSECSTWYDKLELPEGVLEVVQTMVVVMRSTAG